MAYNRVNWEDKPSTATPINAENLNKMDKGIADVDISKIDKTDMVQTDTINDPAKVPSSAVTYGLGQQVTQLNNNLANFKRITKTIASTGTSVITHTPLRFAYLVNIQGTTLDGWACYVLQGYGIGTSVRNNIVTIGAESGISIEIVNNTFVINNTSSKAVNMVVTVLMGDMPTIS